MKYDGESRRRLLLLELVCGLLVAPALLAWLVNLEMAIKVITPTWTGRDRLLDAPAFDVFYRLAADLSTVSTLVVVLLLFFPMIMAHRMRHDTPQQPGRSTRRIYTPYPPHFPFFLVMLGLVGTLYGLFIGLTISGVTELGARAASPESIQDALDQLLDGTATALLSSLWGLIGAFVAARPVPWLFRWAAWLPAAEEPVQLSDTLRRLNTDLTALGESVRLFQDDLANTAIKQIPDTLADIHRVLDALHMDQRKAWEQERDRQEAAMRAAGTAADKQAALLQSLSGHMEQQRDQIAALIQAVSEGVHTQHQAAAQRDRMCTVLEAQKALRSEERQALRHALHEFLEPNRTDEAGRAP